MGLLNTYNKQGGVRPQQSMAELQPLPYFVISNEKNPMYSVLKFILFSLKNI
jgi:hypothetical protein